MPGEPYPTMRYHPTDPPVMCNTVEEVQALGPLWRPEPYSPEETAAAHNAQAMREAHTPPPTEPPPEIDNTLPPEPEGRGRQAHRPGQAPPLPADDKDDDKDDETPTPRSRR